MQPVQGRSIDLTVAELPQEHRKTIDDDLYEALDELLEGSVKISVAASIVVGID